MKGIPLSFSLMSNTADMLLVTPPRPLSPTGTQTQDFSSGSFDSCESHRGCDGRARCISDGRLDWPSRRGLSVVFCELLLSRLTW